MLQLKLVKGANLTGSKNKVLANNEESLLQGTNVLKHVVLPWFGTNGIVCVLIPTLLLLVQRRNCITMDCNSLEFLKLQRLASPEPS